MAIYAFHLGKVSGSGIWHARTAPNLFRHRDTLTDQLHTALDSRVLIEQAKGVLAERLQVDLDQAFTPLRHAARTRNRRLSDLARAVVDGTEQLPGAKEPRSAR